MLNPKLRNSFSTDSVVVFDECHNIDEACLEALSMNLNCRTLDQANACIKVLDQALVDNPGLVYEEGVFLDDEILS